MGLIGYLLAIDAGKSVGWARLYTDGRAIRWLDGGTLRHDDPTLPGLIGNETIAQAVVIEAPSGFAYEPKRVACLLDAARIAGVIQGVAEWTAHRIIMTTAGEVRKALCGRANATDAMVKAAVGRVVENVPKRSNSHQRDAIAAGWWAIRSEEIAMRRRA